MARSNASERLSVARAQCVDPRLVKVRVAALMVSGHNQVRQAQQLTEAIAGCMYSEKPGEAGTARQRRTASRRRP